MIKMILKVTMTIKYLKSYWFEILWLVIDWYGNFHLTDTDTDMLIITDADTDKKENKFTDTDNQKRNSPIPIWKIIRYRYNHFN